MTTLEILKNVVHKQGVHEAQGEALLEAVNNFKVATLSVKKYLENLMNGTIEPSEFVTEVEIEKLKADTDMEKFSKWLSDYNDVEIVEITDYPKAYSVSVAIFYLYEVFVSTHEDKRDETTNVFDENYPFNASFDDFISGLEAPEEDE